MWMCLLFDRWFTIEMGGHDLSASRFGVAEAIGATIFVGLSVDYCLHLAHAYNEAPGTSSRKKLREALVVIGLSCVLPNQGESRGRCEAYGCWKHGGSTGVFGMPPCGNSNRPADQGYCGRSVPNR